MANECVFCWIVNGTSPATIVYQVILNLDWILIFNSLGMIHVFNLIIHIVQTDEIITWLLARLYMRTTPMIFQLMIFSLMDAVFIQYIKL